MRATTRGKEEAMARYRYSKGYASRSFGSSRSGGFTNHRTGGYVSAARAHQHTGQSFGGYTKVKSATTGNYYMKKG